MQAIVVNKNVDIKNMYLSVIDMCLLKRITKKKYFESTKKDLVRSLQTRKFDNMKLTGILEEIILILSKKNLKKTMWRQISGKTDVQLGVNPICVQNTL